MKARDSDALVALRTAIAAIDNAEAVAAPDVKPSVASAHVAGASSGARSSEAARRDLGGSQLLDILRDRVAEDEREADRYEEMGQREAAQRLRRQADILAAYLD
jgi:uncharacterized protein